MRDALGGLVNIAIIVVFLVIVSGYLAFNVNYTKAFRVKNKIISTIENNEGLDSDGRAKISDYMQSIGYDVSIPTNFSSAGWTVERGFAWKTADSSTGVPGGSVTDNVKKQYYEVVTFVTIDIPIIKKIMPQFQFFQVKGTTKSIKIR